MFVRRSVHGKAVFSQKLLFNDRPVKSCGRVVDILDILNKKSRFFFLLILIENRTLNNEGRMPPLPVHSGQLERVRASTDVKYCSVTN